MGQDVVARVAQIDEVLALLTGDASEMTRRVEMRFAETVEPGSKVTQEGREEPVWVHANGKAEPLPRFLKSLDALLPLLPEGWHRVVDASAPELGIDVDLLGNRPNKDGSGRSENVRGRHSNERVATMVAILEAIKTDLLNPPAETPRVIPLDQGD